MGNGALIAGVVYDRADSDEVSHIFVPKCDIYNSTTSFGADRFDLRGVKFGLEGEPFLVQEHEYSKEKLSRVPNSHEDISKYLKKAIFLDGVTDAMDKLRGNSYLGLVLGAFSENKFTLGMSEEIGIKVTPAMFVSFPCNTDYPLL